MTRQRADALVALLESIGESFEAASECPWLEMVEHAYSFALPDPFRSLVQFYRWPEFELGFLRAFSNLGERDEYDLQVAPFLDRPIAEWLQSRRLL